MPTRIRQFLVELLIIHIVWNLSVLGIWVLATWIDQGAPGEGRYGVVGPLTGAVMIVFPFALVPLFRRLHGREFPTGLYVVGMAFWMMLGMLGYELWRNAVRSQSYEVVEFSTTAEMAEYAKSVDPLTRRHTAIHLPDLAPVELDSGNHVKRYTGNHHPGPVRVKGGNSRIPHSVHVWPIFAKSEQPDPLTGKIRVHVWQGQTGSAQILASHPQNGWFRFEEDLKHYTVAAKNAISVDRKEGQGVLRMTGELVVVTRIRPPLEERALFQQAVTNFFIAANVSPLLILAWCRWRSSRKRKRGQTS
ncbi:MAG: hypothetical protein CL681_14480 [Blastopirellula sp.]|jgi:hypothetical protein|nr:hypothetical protein [Blastopirellula sp.]